MKITNVNSFSLATAQLTFKPIADNHLTRLTTNRQKAFFGLKEFSYCGQIEIDQNLFNNSPSLLPTPKFR